MDANANLGADEIVFDSTLAGEIITLETGELIITDDLTIDGSNGITIDGNQSSRIFNIDDGNDDVEKNITLDGLTIANGRVDDETGGGIHNLENLTASNSTITGNNAFGNIDIGNSHGDGGGIFNGGTVSIFDSIISDNRAGYGIGGGIANDGTATIVNSYVTDNFTSYDYGGGVGNEGTLTITDSTINDNSANWFGAGIFNGTDAVATVTNSIIDSNNSYYARGGGILNYGEMYVSGSAIVDNVLNDSGFTVPRGAGVLNTGTVTISNSTLSGNVANADTQIGAYPAYGGGLYNLGTATLKNSTISGNSVSKSLGKGGGIYNKEGVINLASTIVGDNISSDNNPDIINNEGTVSAQFSLIEDGVITEDLGNNIIGIDPELDPAGLQDNGGPTPTIALQPNSPAIDAGSNPDSLDFDQRGESFDREINGQADIGAFEVQDPAPQPDTSLLFSISHNDRINGLSVKNEDIVQFDGNDFSILFDGSDVGLGGRKLSAFDVISHNEILISLNKAKNLPGIGKVRPQDVIKFTATSLGDRTAGHFSKYFDGSDVGLFGSHDQIDAITGLPNGDLLLSTAGRLSAKGGYRAGGEDISRFKPKQLGANTRGKFSRYFDGSDVGLGHNNVDAFAIDSQGDLIFSTDRAFQSRSLSARKEDVFGFTPTSLGGRTRGSFASDVLFDGSQFSLRGNNLLGIDLVDPVPLS
ncbi:MAG: choice-of-anchor Q domain-containing protein [Cyanobacteria bacterium P01_E01_bin.45]